MCCYPANAAYLAADHHVYIVMNILSVSVLLVIVPYILLYRTMKPANQQQQVMRTSGNVASIELNSLLNQDTVELEIGGDSGLVSLENGDWCVEKDSGGLGDGQREVEGGTRGRGKFDSDKTQLLENMESSSEED